jgi:hypothetical protein
MPRVVRAGTRTRPSSSGACATPRDTGPLSDRRLLLCDRDPKWSSAVEQWLGTAGVHVVRTPPSALNCNAYAERFVRSAKEECLDRIVPLGDRHLWRTVQEFAAHYHRERHDQGLANELIDRPAGATSDWRRSPPSAVRRDVELRPSVSGVGSIGSSVGQNGVISCRGARHQRDHGEGRPRTCHAEDTRRFACPTRRPCSPARDIRSAAREANRPVRRPTGHARGRAKANVAPGPSFGSAHMRP